MATNVKQLIDAANAAVPEVAPAEAREMIAKGNTLVVDVRDAPELEKSGKVAGAVHHSRGMLELPSRTRRLLTMGTFAVQLCRLYGANAIAVVSSDDKRGLVSELGA